MVQESEGSQQNGKVCQSWDNTSRKTGFQSMQNKGQDTKNTAEKKNPWGPVFKDKKNFTNMHNC